MKTLILTTAMLLTVAFSGPAAKAGSRATNVRGYVVANETYALVDDTLLIDGTGSGSDSFGKFTVTYHFDLDITNGSATGSHQFTRSNGETLTTTSVAKGIETGLTDVNYVTELHTVTGGTGRFSQASGSFVVQRMTGFPLGSTAGWFDGQIVRVMQ